MIRHKKIEEPLREVQKWKKKVSTTTKGMSIIETVKYFHQQTEDAWQKHSYKRVPPPDNLCNHTGTPTIQGSPNLKCFSSSISIS